MHLAEERHVHLFFLAERNGGIEALRMQPHGRIPGRWYADELNVIGLFPVAMLRT